MSEPRKLYWDSSCFICFLNDAGYERARRAICDDVLHNAQNNVVQIWTSTFTIVEVIRPKRRGRAPLPPWAEKAIQAIEKEFPEARNELNTLWSRYQANEPTTKLTKEQIGKISAMFEWDFVKKIELNEPVANEAVRLARDYGLRPADSIHAASAILRKVDVLQRWDRDFDKVKGLIKVEEPQQISPQASLFAGAPRPEDFEPPAEANSETERNEKS